MGVDNTTAKVINKDVDEDDNHKTEKPKRVRYTTFY